MRHDEKQQEKTALGGGRTRVFFKFDPGWKCRKIICPKIETRGAAELRYFPSTAARINSVLISDIDMPHFYSAVSSIFGV